MKKHAKKKSPHLHERGKRFATRPLVLVKGGDGPFLDAVIDEVQARGWQLLDVETSWGGFPLDPPPLGAILEEEPELEERLHGLGIPVVRVRLDPGPPPQPDMCHLALDGIAGAQLAAEHFAERRFRDVGYVAHTPTGGLRKCFDAFCKRAKELGCTCHPFYLEQDPSADEMVRLQRRTRAFTEWLMERPRPIGLYTFTRTATAVCNMCNFAGVHVPEEVAILCNSYSRSECLVTPVPLSAVEFGDDLLGLEAVRLLESLAAGGPEPKTLRMIPPKGVVLNRSTDILAVDDAKVARALRFMWDHLSQPLTVLDVAAELAVSRRTLERAFRQALGRGINVELRRKRLETARELLRMTDRSIAGIAEAVGFGSVNYLHRAFRREFGMTPRQYRQGLLE